MDRLLVVEDCSEARALVARALNASFQIRFAESVREALARVDERPPDMFLIDLALPDGDGFDLCAALQGDERTRDAPVIFLTSSDDTRDKVAAFSLGADDYIVKPFDPIELRARAEGRLRKARSTAERQELVAIGDVRLDLTCLIAWREEPGGRRDLSLTPHELRLLRHLGRREGRLVTRDELLEEVWGSVVVTRRTVDTHVSNLRRKLGPGAPRIEGVRGLGYRLVPSARSAGHDASARSESRGGASQGFSAGR